jgi:hypothetical protein
MQHVKNIQCGYLLNKYLKCSVWRLAVRCDIYMSLGGKGFRSSQPVAHSFQSLFPEYALRSAHKRATVLS